MRHAFGTWRNGQVALLALLGTTALASQALAQAPAGVTVTTQAALENPKAEDWLHVNGNYSSHRWSTLNQITLANIKGLKPVFMLAINGVEGGGSRYANASLEGTPIVEDGFMYVSNGWGSVYKLNVKSGTRAQIDWYMDPQVDKPWGGDVACCGIDNRGVALYQDKVISVTIDGRLIATSKASGEIVWQAKPGDPGRGETLTVAPQVVRNIGIVGVAGAEYGIRGHLNGTDLNTGKEVWKTWTVAGEDDPNAKTWGGRSNLTGGGSIWQTGSYDPRLNLVYWGTGNPGPDWDSAYRPGDNLYTDSVLAMNPDTGKINWYFQYTPNDPYDYDEIGVHPLATVNINGQDRNLVVHPGRNGVFYGFDRSNGQFLYGEKYVDQLSWTQGIDPKTGKPTAYDPTKQVQDYIKGSQALRDGTVGVQCPVVSGGQNWEPAAVNPQKGVIYVAGGDGCAARTNKAETGPAEFGGTWKPRDRFVGAGDPAPADKYGNGFAGVSPPAPARPEWKIQQYGAINSIDLKTGKVIKKFPLKYFNRSGVVATAGGWIMTGEPDGTLHALNADTFDEVFNFNVGSYIKAPPMTYSVGGKQYVAVMVGALPAAAEFAVNPELRNFTATHMLMVFGL
ncbi:MAG: PQQ-binding-like beta-propeller repeat protein [Bauldia sp.]